MSTEKDFWSRRRPSGETFSAMRILGRAAIAKDNKMKLSGYRNLVERTEVSIYEDEAQGKFHFPNEVIPKLRSRRSGAYISYQWGVHLGVEVELDPVCFFVRH